jgi:hypothetical protein
MMKIRLNWQITVFQKINSNFRADCEFVVFTNGMKTDRGLLQCVDRTQDTFKIRLLKITRQMDC